MALINRRWLDLDPASPESLTTEVLKNTSGVSTDTVIATINETLLTKANLESASLTGTPTAPTPSSADNSTRLATTAFVKTELATLISTAPTTLDTFAEFAAAINNDANYASTITTALATKVTANTAIVGGTGTKITYDSKGLVTSSTSLSASDIPDLSATYLSGTVPINKGGTNATSFTAPSGNVSPLVYFDGTRLNVDSTVADAGYDTVTHTLVSKNFSATGVSTLVGVKETKVTMAANNIDLVLGTVFSKTISGATTLTVSNVPSSGNVGAFILNVTNGGSAVITWFTGVKWVGGTAPTLTTAGRDRIGFITEDGGTTWDGFVMGKDLK